MSAETSKVHSLGEAFSQQAFSEEEQVRLASLASKGGIAAHIIKRYVTHTDAYKNGFRKHEKIAGFRQATPAFDQQAIPLIIRWLGDARHRRHRVCWELYRFAAIAFIEKELPHLNELLSEVPAPTDPTDAAEMLKAVCANASDFAVSQDDVKKFYELWGVSRVAGFDDLLPLCLYRDEEKAQKRAIAKLVADVETLDAAMRENAAHAEVAAAAAARERTLAEEDRARLRSVDEALQSLSRRLSDITAKTAVETESRAKGFEERLASAGERINSTDLAAKQLREQVTKVAVQTKSAIAVELGVVVADLKRTWTAELAAATTELEARLAARSSAAFSARQLHEERGKTAGGFEWTSAEHVINDTAGLRRALTAAFKARGVAPGAAMRIHAAIAAGLVPLVAGPTALLALDAYAAAACGGRGVTVYITPSLSEPSELFGRVDSVRGSFSPHAAGLLDVLQAATGARGAALVSLEGVNRAPTESYLLPLLLMRSRGGRIPLFHPSALLPTVAGVDPVVVWPENLLLAATSVDGPTSLPISRDLLAHAVVIEVDACEATASRSDVSLSEIRLEGEVVTPGDSPTNIVDDLVQSFPDVRAYRRSLTRFAALLGRFESDAGRVRTALVESILVPLAVTLEHEEERAEALGALSKDLGPEQREELLALARRTRRRVG